MLRVRRGGLGLENCVRKSTLGFVFLHLHESHRSARDRKKCVFTRAYSLDLSRLFPVFSLTDPDIQ